MYEVVAVAVAGGRARGVKGWWIMDGKADQRPGASVKI